MAAVVLGVLSEEVACGGCGGSKQLSGEGEGARAEPPNLRGLRCGGRCMGGGVLHGAEPQTGAG